LTSTDKSIVVSFVSELMRKADYGILGEKPLAIIATLKYLREKGITGKRLFELLSGPHVKAIRSIFLELAQKYSPIDEPQTSWNIIVGKRKELQQSIGQFRFGDVNKAFSQLTPEEIEALYNSYDSRLTQTKR
jgi:hypothetical protein